MALNGASAATTASRYGHNDGTRRNSTRRSASAARQSSTDRRLLHGVPIERQEEHLRDGYGSAGAEPLIDMMLLRQAEIAEREAASARDPAWGPCSSAVR
ncbi:hypothetical protein ACTOB_005450 [Actinoplanes oblitus]|uniref:Uncharacterized protein n=1 Tax=Actinoplanes oblitus TaxID=3040509 RepID=A0ABY8W6L4_9ACTN|nr:hypothetical protein [Actinoplanes oblitus]WIM93471.1 hypothetical protein ACTOB_005450 [Actinoplanes oblitus]